MSGIAAFICDGVRTPIGRYGGSLASVRADDLAAIPIAALLARNPLLDPSAIDDVYLGCANQAGEDNRNVARMAALLAGLPERVPGSTINRLCGSGLDAIASAARAIAAGDIDLALAGGVESMTRAPFVMPKSGAAFSREHTVYDTTIGWRFVNPLMKERYGIDSMPETGENVAAEFNVSRADQDAFALRVAATRSSRTSLRQACERDRASRSTDGQNDGIGRSRRASARNDAREARGIADAVSRGRYGNGGQRFRGQRRCSCLDRCVGEGGQKIWTDTARAHHCCSDRRCRAARDGHRADLCDAQTARACRPLARGL